MRKDFTPVEARRVPGTDNYEMVDQAGIRRGVVTSKESTAASDVRQWCWYHRCRCTNIQSYERIINPL